MYRSIDTAIWTDPKVKTLPPEGKLLFLYLITNNHAHVSGIYHLPSMLIAHETGLENTLVDTLFNTLSERRLAFHDTRLEVVWVVNMLRYQGSGGRIKLAVEHQLASLHHCPLIDVFLKYYKDLNLHYARMKNTLPDTLFDTLLDSPSSSFQEQDQEQDQEQEGESRARACTCETKTAAVDVGHITRFEAQFSSVPSRRCPATFVPSPATRQWADKRFPDVDFDEALEAMKDYEFDRPHEDWDAVLKTWIRREAKEFAGGRTRASPKANPTYHDGKRNFVNNEAEKFTGESHGRSPGPEALLDGDGTIIDGVEYHPHR